MTRHTLRTADGEGFIRAFTDEWKDIEQMYEVKLHLSIEPTGRKGILLHRLTAWLCVGGSRDFPQASVRVEYPSSQVQSYEAFLYSLGVKLERVLEMQKAYPEGRS